MLRMTLTLDKNQKNAVKLFHAGYNLFITGSGGCGKSKLIIDMVVSVLVVSPRQLWLLIKL